MSHLTVARSADGLSDWRIDAQPTFPAAPDGYPEELWGIEDPRITYLEEQGRWFIAYTAYSSAGPCVSLASTADFRSFERLGPVMPRAGRTGPERRPVAGHGVRRRRPRAVPARRRGRPAPRHRPSPGRPHGLRPRVPRADPGLTTIDQPIGSKASLRSSRRGRRTGPLPAPTGAWRLCAKLAKPLGIVVEQDKQILHRSTHRDLSRLVLLKRPRSAAEHASRLATRC